MSEHLDPGQALALAALSEDEPERSAARAHASGCEACRALLDESALMLQLLDSSMARPAIGPALKARIERQTYGRSFGGSALLLAALALVSFVLAWKNGHPLDAPTPSPARSCAAFESAYALAPLLIGATLTRMGKLRLSPARFAAYTMAFAIVGQVVLRRHCAAHDLSQHLLLSHFLVVLAAGLVGAGTARLLQARA